MDSMVVMAAFTISATAESMVNEIVTIVGSDNSESGQSGVVTSVGMNRMTVVTTAIGRRTIGGASSTLLPEHARRRNRSPLTRGPAPWRRPQLRIAPES
jgi:hypothetical protein